MIKKFSEEKIEKALANTKASFAMEGFEIPNDVSDVIKRRFLGELSEEETLSYLKERKGE